MLKKTIMLLLLTTNLFAQDVIIPANEWAPVLQKDESGEFKALTPYNPVFYWVPSANKPDYADCSRGRKATNDSPPYIVGAPNTIWVCTTRKESITISVSKDSGSFSR